MIREILGGGDVIELGGGVILFGPSLATIDGCVAAAIVGIGHAFGVRGSDPEVVIVAMGDADGLVRLACVNGFIEAGVEDVDGVGVLGIGIDA